MISLKRLRSKIENLFNKGVPVLMYHRIYSPEADPWQLSVSPENFERQLQFLRKRYNIISLDTLSAQLEAGKLGSQNLVLTFDDCYSDNYHFAKPLLEKYECPATFFVPSALIGRSQLFWWDELQQLIMHTLVLPDKLELFIGSEKFEHDFKSVVLKQEEAEAQSKWSWTEKPPTERADVYMQIWTLLQPLQAEQIRKVLDQIKLRFNKEPETGPFDMPMNFSQLQEIEHSPLFSLAIHTSTHPKLSGLSENAQREEIVECKKWLLHHFGETMPSIAYPYGSHNKDTLKVLREEKIKLGFTTETTIVKTNSPRLELGRLQILNWDARELETFLTRMR